MCNFGFVAGPISLFFFMKICFGMVEGERLRKKSLIFCELSLKPGLLAIKISMTVWILIIS